MGSSSASLRKLLSTDPVAMGIERQTVANLLTLGKQCLQRVVKSKLLQQQFHVTFSLLHYQLTVQFPPGGNLRGDDSFLIVGWHWLTGFLLPLLLSLEPGWMDRR